MTTWTILPIIIYDDGNDNDIVHVIVLGHESALVDAIVYHKYNLKTEKNK